MVLIRIYHKHKHKQTNIQPLVLAVHANEVGPISLIGKSFLKQAKLYLRADWNFHFK